MRKKTITLRVDAQKRKTLDAIAVRIDAVNEWQTAHIKAGLRQADAGKFAKDSEVAAAFARRWPDEL